MVVFLRGFGVLGFWGDVYKRQLMDYLDSPYDSVIGMVTKTEEERDEIYDRVSDKTLIVLIDEDDLRIKLSQQIITVDQYHNSSERDERGELTEYSLKTLPLLKK